MMTIDEAHGSTELITERRSGIRRGFGDRRRNEAQGTFTGQERRQAPVERREKVERRRQIDPTTCERDYTEDEVEFMGAMDHYKRRSGRQFPTWSEVLEVVRSLGYRKVAEPTEVEM